MSKAQRALSTARLLLKEGDTEGACNRAYYAMFYAAHVALLSVSDAPVSDYKTHRGLIAAFGKKVILAGLMDFDLGRALNEVQRLRQLADYIGDAPPLEHGTRAVTQAEKFVETMKNAFAPSDE